MPAHQKYSGRMHTKRQLSRAVGHLRSTALVLSEVVERYEEAVPLISVGCKQALELVDIIEVMVIRIKEDL